MTVTLTLEVEKVALTARAEATEAEIETVLHRLASQLARKQEHARKQEQAQKQKAVLTLLDAWTTEKETLSPEDLAANDAEFEEFKVNINRWRAEEGRGPAFP